MASTSTRIEELFDEDRLPHGWLLLPFLLYFPVGLALALLRLFIGFHTFLVSCLLPKTLAVRSFILRVMCFVLGIVVSEVHAKHKNKSAKIVVANNVTILDYLAVDLVLPCTMPNELGLPKILTWLFGHKDLGFDRGLEVLIPNVQRHCQESELPILVHPEGATTNGRFGLLRFSSWPFSVGQPISPVVLQVRRPYLLNVSNSVVGSRWWSDLFWFLFSPCTLFNVRYLPEMRRPQDTTDDEFARLTQEAMAAALDLRSTALTRDDKREYLKRVSFRPPPATPPARPSPASDPRIRRMAYQVKEVLPYVPLDAIARDLVRTNSVSLTISNILEGVVNFIPEAEVAALPASSSAPYNRQAAAGPSFDAGTASSSSADAASVLRRDAAGSGSPNQFYSSLDTSASCFGRTADERMLSYQERKSRLIETARRRYLEKQQQQLAERP